MLTVRVGCNIHFESQSPATAILIVTPRSDPDRPLRQEQLVCDPLNQMESFVDSDGNLARRVILGTGTNVIRHDALIDVPAAFDRCGPLDDAPAIATMPVANLRYLLPSRYCDSDRLYTFAAQKFGHILHAGDRAVAICDWVHDNIEYRFGSGRPDISASQIIERGHGVCRDFAHCMIALCRALNLPARYATGHLPDIGHLDPGTPMDFHAYSEVYLGDRWQVFDARYNEPRVGRIKIAHGLDAVECAFATVYGAALLTHFEIWAYQVDPREVSIGDPIDLSKRLDGLERIKTAPPE
jgi:transglutaminase-like putative cysteine protease